MEKSAVEKIIDERIKPALESHGGSIELLSVEDNIVKVRLTGACGTCPHAMMTLKMGVEHVLKEEFPELVEVVSAD